MPDEILFIESQTLGSVETASDGTYPVTILTPGLGATAYYSESVIAQHAPKAFPKHTHVYLSHQRGEGGEPDPGRLLGSLVEDTTIRESDGAAVNRFKPIRQYADFVEDVHRIVGLSIAARGASHMGMIEGRQVRIADSIDYHIANTVDMVSYPGRPGSGFVESAFAQTKDVHPDPSADGVMKEGNEMAITDEQFLELSTAVTKLATLVESGAAKAPTAEEEAVKLDVKSAVAATRIVESAEVSDDLKTKLIEGIEAGNYDVQPEIDAHKALRESIKTELTAQFKESGFATVGAAGAAGGADKPIVNGWAH